jgi:hypothetical protein
MYVRLSFYYASMLPIILIGQDAGQLSIGLLYYGATNIISISQYINIMNLLYIVVHATKLLIMIMINYEWQQSVNV